MGEKRQMAGGHCAHRQGDARRRARRVNAKEHDGTGRARRCRHVHGDEGAPMGLVPMGALVSRGRARGRRRHGTRRRAHGNRLRHVAAFLLHVSRRPLNPAVWWLNVCSFKHCDVRQTVCTHEHTQRMGRVDDDDDDDDDEKRPWTRAQRRKKKRRAQWPSARHGERPDEKERERKSARHVLCHIRADRGAWRKKTNSIAAPTCIAIIKGVGFFFYFTRSLAETRWPFFF